MNLRYFRLFLSLIVCLGSPALTSLAASPIEDGVYRIACTKQDGFLGLGTYHGVDPYIYYVTNGQEVSADGYWKVTGTPSGYTFRNEATDELLVFTYERVDQYYKYMTLATEPLGDGSEFWNIIEGADGAYSIQSAVDTDYYWNLRNGTNMMGTYKGSNGTAENERIAFFEKPFVPEPVPDVSYETSFPEALHVYLSDGRLEAYPMAYITDYTEEDGMLVIATNIGQDFTYDLSEVDSVSERTPLDFPTFDAFRFNKKNNDQLFDSAVGEMVGDTVFFQVAAIGKRLTATFTLTADETDVYADGELQTSTKSRLRFDRDIYYTIARWGQTMLLPRKDAEGEYAMLPYGRMVRVHVDWLTDRAEVPTIYINTADGQAITSRDYYKDATISIDGHDIFPSMEETYVQIKGRGNSSWGWPKKPYRLKFEEKVKPLGMTKGKSWVLLSNYQQGSIMSNAIGMKAANLMDAAAANHIVPVDLYLNGQYVGSYNFTEKVGFSNNSVELDDESYAALLELDSYYDEPDGQKFRSAPYDLPVNVKEPDFSDSETLLTLDMVSTSFNRFLTTLYRGQDISRYVDLEQLARFLMVNELTLNYEIFHPKSTFCYRENFTDDNSKYIFGPVWDLDWGFGYERNKNYFSNEANVNYWINMPNFEAVSFVQDLRFKYQPLSDIYQELWEQFMENGLQELMEYAQDYYDFAHNSFDANAQRWGDNTNYAQQAQTAANWLQTRSEQIYEDILSGKKPDIPEPAEPVEFANNKLYTITSWRGALVLTADHNGLTVEQERNFNYPSEDAQFAIITIGEQNYLYSPVTKMFLSHDGGNAGLWVNQLGMAITFDESHPYGNYPYMIIGTNENGQSFVFNHNGRILVIDGYTNPDQGNRWKVEEAGDFDPTEALELASQSLYAVTNRYIWNGEVVGEETKHLPKGAYPPEPSKRWNTGFVKLVEPDDMPFVIEDETTIDYQVDWQGPFEFTTSSDNAYWYNMTIRSLYHVARQETEPYVPYETDEETYAYDPNYYWAFGGNPYGVVVYNYATGFEQSLTAVNDYAVMREGQYAWDVLPNLDGFLLRQPGTEYACLNQIGGKDGPLKFWYDNGSLTDNGSTFRIVEANPSGLFAAKAEAKPVKVLRPDGHIYIMRNGKTYTTSGIETRSTGR